MRKRLVLFALAAAAPLRVAGQAATCPQPLATLVVAPLSYAELPGAPLGRPVFVYVPEIRGGGAQGFLPFQLWIVEGVYGRPFLRSRGRLEAAAVESLRGRPNVRATSIAVVRGDGSDGGVLSVRRARYRVQVLKVNPQGAGVEVSVCR